MSDQAGGSGVEGAIAGMALGEGGLINEHRFEETVLDMRVCFQVPVRLPPPSCTSILDRFPPSIDVPRPRLQGLHVCPMYSLFCLHFQQGKNPSNPSLPRQEATPPHADSPILHPAHTYAPKCR